MIRSGASLALATLALANCGGSKTYRIPSSAMEPTLHCARPAPGCEAAEEDRIRVTVTTDVARGDIVVFHAPPLARERCGTGGTFVKRVSGLPREGWSERNGVVYIDGKRLAEPYLRAERRDSETHGAIRLDKDEFFLLGDNRQASCDSRVWGPVPRRNIVGKVTEILRGSGTIPVR